MTPTAMTNPDELKAVSTLASAWQRAGTRAPALPSSYLPFVCSIPGCAAMPYVELKTPEGPRGLCFRHLESVKEDLVATSGKP